MSVTWHDEARIERGVPVDHGTARVVHHLFGQRLCPEADRPVGEALDEVHQGRRCAAMEIRLHASSRFASALANETRKYGDMP